MSFVIIRCSYFLALHFPLDNSFPFLSSFLSFVLLVLCIVVFFLPEKNGYKITGNKFFVCKLKVSLISSTH